MRAGKPRHISYERGNESYVTDDGLSFRLCRRCGITFGAHAVSVAAFCADCNHPDLIGVFRLLDYSYIFESEAA